MVTVKSQPCWRGDVDLTPLLELYSSSDFSGLCPNNLLQDLQFIPVYLRDIAPPFSPETVPIAHVILDLPSIPLWMFSEMSWTLQTTCPSTATFFSSLFSFSAVLPDQTYTFSLLLTAHDNTQVLITAQNSTLYARTLTTILHPLLSTKHESPEPQLNMDNAGQIELTSGQEGCLGQLISVVSPQRMLRETSSNPFDAKLESPGRINPKGRRERRVQSLLPDIARRRKAEMELGGTEIQDERGRGRGVKMEEMENPFESRMGRQMSVTRGREGSVVSVRGREGSVVRRTSREESLVRSTSSGTIVPRVRESSALDTNPSLDPPNSKTEAQTKEAVKQTVVAALRLHSIPSSHQDYKLLIQHTVSASMFALRGKTRVGRIAGMGEIGGVVEGLLDVFLRGM